MFGFGSRAAELTSDMLCKARFTSANLSCELSSFQNHKKMMGNRTVSPLSAFLRGHEQIRLFETKTRKILT